MVSSGMEYKYGIFYLIERDGNPVHLPLCIAAKTRAFGYIIGFRPIPGLLQMLYYLFVIVEKLRRKIKSVEFRKTTAAYFHIALMLVGMCLRLKLSRC